MKNYFPECGPNEHFQDCGTSCEPTCSNYQNTPPHCHSHYYCRRGCFCDYGHVRDMAKNGKCVPIDKCRKSFKIKSHFRYFIASIVFHSRFILVIIVV